MRQARKSTAHLPACAFAAVLSTLSVVTVEAREAKSLPPPDPVANSAARLTEYRIIPQDVLDVTVLQLPELSQSVTVDNKGKIVLPFVGELAVANKTAQEVSEDLTQALSARFMKNPQVTVRVSQAQGQKVTVDGAVGAPGAYSLTGPTSLLQAVALAKGADPRLANERRVAVFRTVGGARRMAVFNLHDIRNGQAEDPAVYGGDIIVVDTSGAKSFLQSYQGGFGLLGMLFAPW